MNLLIKMFCLTRRLSSSQRLIITAIGRDRIGLVRDVSEAIFQCEGNILRSQHIRLSGSFSNMILAEFPSEKLAAAKVGLENLQQGIGLKLVVNDAVKPSNLLGNAEKYNVSMTIESPDQIGIVNSITSYLSSLGVNIEVLSTQTISQASDSLSTFRINSKLSVPGIVEYLTLQQKLQEMSEKFGFNLKVSKI